MPAPPLGAAQGASQLLGPLHQVPAWSRRDDLFTPSPLAPGNARTPTHWHATLGACPLLSLARRPASTPCSLISSILGLLCALGLPPSSFLCSLHDLAGCGFLASARIPHARHVIEPHRDVHVSLGLLQSCSWPSRAMRCLRAMQACSSPELIPFLSRVLSTVSYRSCQPLSTGLLLLQYSRFFPPTPIDLHFSPAGRIRLPSSKPGPTRWQRPQGRTHPAPSPS